jgi:hypothetical protein
MRSSNDGGSTKTTKSSPSELVGVDVVDHPHGSVGVAFAARRRKVQRDVRRERPVEQPRRQAVVLREREPVPRRVLGNGIARRVLAEVA